MPADAAGYAARVVPSRRKALIVLGALAAAVALHVLQVAAFGHDLLRVADGHGLEFVTLAWATPSPTLVLAACAGLIVAVVVVRSVVLGEVVVMQPLSTTSASGFTTRVAPVAPPRVRGLSRHVAGRAPPQLAR